MIKKIIRYIGKIFGIFLKSIWSTLKKGGHYFLILLVLIIASLFVFVGNVVLLILSVLGSLLILGLKGFAWITTKTLGITKDFGDKLGEYSEEFFQGIQDTFKKDKDELEEQLISIKLEI